MHYLYIITNKLNNKVYIGQSNNNRRWSQHKYFAKYPDRTGQYIHRAMAKYGIENFIFEIVASCHTYEDADNIEKILIEQYNSCDKEFGYNIKPGGNNVPHSEETKEKLRQATLKQIAEKGHPAQGTKRTPEQLITLSNARKEHPVEYTPEIRQKMSESHIGKIIPEEQRKKMSIGIKENWDERNAARLATGELKCNAPGCNVSGIASYRIINNIRYCMIHGLRLLRNGILDKLPPFKYTEDNPMPEEVRKKCGVANIGRIPYNKKNFTTEQIINILSDPRSNRKIAKDFGVTEKVIKRIKTENKL